MVSSEIINLAENIQTFTSNAYLIKGETPVLIDAGNNPKILENLTDEIEELDKILLTHFHPDHVGQVEEIKDRFDSKVLAFNEEENWVDEAVEDRRKIEAGNKEFTAIYTPGHHPSHMVFYGDGVLFSGDLIFPGGSYGRTDLPGGNSEKLAESVKKVKNLVDGDLEKLYPGHMSPVLNNAEEEIRRCWDLLK